MLTIQTKQACSESWFYVILDSIGEILDSYNGFNSESQAYSAAIEAINDFGIDYTP